MSSARENDGIRQCGGEGNVPTRFKAKENVSISGDFWMSREAEDMSLLRARLRIYLKEKKKKRERDG